MLAMAITKHALHWVLVSRGLDVKMSATTSHHNVFELVAASNHPYNYIIVTLWISPQYLAQKQPVLGVQLEFDPRWLDIKVSEANFAITEHSQPFLLCYLRVLK